MNAIERLHTVKANIESILTTMEIQKGLLLSIHLMISLYHSSWSYEEGKYYYGSHQQVVIEECSNN